MKISMLAIASLAVSVSGEFYVKEQFNDDSWKDSWTVPADWKPSSEMGEWKRTAGKWYGDANDTGLQTSEDARFYGMSRKMDKTFDSSNGKDLVIQYSTKNEHKMDCGGAYIKLLPGGDKFDSAKFGGDTPYGIMFGPDICGNNKRTHVILHYAKKEDNLLINKEIPVQTDKLTHLYTLVVRPDNTFEVFTDNKSVRSGKLEDEFDFLEPQEIKDPQVSKPDDWVDQRRIPDPDSVKPEGYDDILEDIPDPDATKPDDWDDEDDGAWEPPTIDNPEYEGPWAPKMIDNPDFKGAWKHPMISNPDYTYDDKMHTVCSDGCTHIGFELWQVKSGTIFDDIIVTDSLEEAQKFAEETFFKKKDGEKEMYDDVQDAERKAEPTSRYEDDDGYGDVEDDHGLGEEF